MIEKQINHFIAFLDVFISSTDNQNQTLQTYHKATYTKFLLNFKSFTSFSYRINLLKCLVGRLKFLTIGTLFAMIWITGNLVLSKKHIHHS